jgi:hypothetical protein
MDRVQRNTEGKSKPTVLFDKIWKISLQSKKYSPLIILMDNLLKIFRNGSERSNLIVVHKLPAAPKGTLQIRFNQSKVHQPTPLRPHAAPYDIRIFIGKISCFMHRWSPFHSDPSQKPVLVFFNYTKIEKNIVKSYFSKANPMHRCHQSGRYFFSSCAWCSFHPDFQFLIRF